MARSKQFSVEFISDRPGIKTAHGMDALGGSFSTIAGARRSIAKTANSRRTTRASLPSSTLGPTRFPTP